MPTKIWYAPLTHEEFVAVEEEVRAMDEINKKRAAYLAEQISEAKLMWQKKDEEGSFLRNLFGGTLKNGCESNFAK